MSDTGADYAATWQQGPWAHTSRHDSASNAWEHLAKVRQEAEERHGDACEDPACSTYDRAHDLSPAWEILDTLASSADLTPVLGELTLETPACEEEDLVPTLYRVQYAPSRASSVTGLASIVAGAAR